MIINKELINEAKNKLAEKAAYIIAEDLKLDKWDAQALKSCCIWHEEKTASMIWNKKDSHFKSFCCGKVYGILDHYQQHYGFSFMESVKTLFMEVGMDIYDVSFNRSSKDNDDFFKNYKYPNEEKNKNREQVEVYLGKRGISKKTLNFANIKQDIHGNIVFEHRDIDGTLLGVKYRYSRAIKKGESQMFWQKDSSTCPILYGVDRIDITKPLLITEGHIDALSCIEAGYTNVVSIPHGASDSKWIEFNYNFLSNFDEVILYFDNDQAGQKALKESISRIGDHRVKIVKPTKDIEDKIEEYYKQYNDELSIRKTDANNVLLACGSQELLNLINNAQEVEIPDVIKLMQCEEFDINKADIISTGFKNLDKKLYGYIGGTVNIFTGYSGEGKSTTMIQTCVLPALESGHTVFIFSGELHKSLVKNWALFPLASGRNVIEWDNGEFKPKGYTVTNEAKKAIEVFYEDKLFFYDNYLNTKPKAIIEKIIYTYKKYGTKTFVVDNLMCIDFGREDEQYSAQKEFLMELLAITAKYGLFMHLACHPRKPGLNKNPDIYSIFGSSAITNLVHRIFWVMRDFDKESPYDGKIWVGKDRMVGISNEEVKYYYDRPTRRIYTDVDRVDHKYEWEEFFDYKYPQHIAEKLVCNRKNVECEVFG
jgi:hypothetical protein